MTFKYLQKLIQSCHQTQSKLQYYHLKDKEAIVDKEATSHNDVFDAFSLAVKYYRFEKQQ
jgi:hypothetical protein